MVLLNLRLLFFGFEKQLVTQASGRFVLDDFGDCFVDEQYIHPMS